MSALGGAWILAKMGVVKAVKAHAMVPARALAIGDVILIAADRVHVPVCVPVCIVVDK